MRERGFGLLELMITSVLLGGVMLAAYQYLSRTTRFTNRLIDSGSLVEISDRLETKIKKDLRNSGFNPDLVEYAINPVRPGYEQQYDMHPENRNFWDPDRHKKRIGVTFAGPTKIEWASDDNTLIDDNLTSGLINPAERYAFWVGGDNGNSAGQTEDVAAYLAGKVDSDANDPCTLRSGETFGQIFKLYGMVKDAEADKPLEEPTIATMLADNLLCLEFHHYTWDLPDDALVYAQGQWARLRQSGETPRDERTVNGKHYAKEYEMPIPPPGYGELPHTERVFPDGQSEIAYYDSEVNGDVEKLGMTYVHMVRVGLVLLGKETVSGKGVRPTIKRVFDVRLGNWPWQKSVLPPVPGSG